MNLSKSAERIRERAYQIWEIEGRPDGRDREHWLRAEAECRVVKTNPAKKRPARKTAR
jgi:hypothetical protein